MAKVINFISKRYYAVVAESLRFEMTASSVVGKGKLSESASDNGSASNINKVFWMRDPKTGNWVPENHFGEVDVAELRKKVFPKRQNL
ncbi:unnamed protein product [Lupinus luteus]|uniref:Late embryogenesis abundant protein n=1 Tax=Lupinus luteus TaxID=3873 RepID=A0AAV1X2D9_LUPLU